MLQLGTAEAFDASAWVHRDPPNMVLGALPAEAAPVPAQLQNVQVIPSPAEARRAQAKETAGELAKVACALVLGYHGWQRNRSPVWALGWAVLGFFAPVLGGAIAIGQGFGQRRKE